MKTSLQPRAIHFKLSSIGFKIVGFESVKFLCDSTQSPEQSKALHQISKVAWMVEMNLLNILDDLSHLTSTDRSNMASILRKMPENLIVAVQSFKSPSTRRVSRGKPLNVIIAGVGGSSIGGDVVSNWLSEDTTVPILVNRGLSLPRFADENTLVIAISYSGETSETLGQFDEARRRHCILHSIASAGRLRTISNENGVPVAALTPGVPPRTAFPQIIAATTCVLQEYGIIDSLEDVYSAGEGLKKVRDELDVSRDTEQNPAKRMALRLVGKFPIIYSLERMNSAARRLKNQLNENSKIPSKFDSIPEICHNEVESWPELVSEPWRSRASFIFIRDDNEDEREIRIVEGTLSFLRDLGVEDLLEIKGGGPNRLAKLLSAIYLGDYVSFYLAIARGIDPTPIVEITKLKKTLS